MCDKRDGIAARTAAAKALSRACGAQAALQNAQEPKGSGTAAALHETYRVALVNPSDMTALVDQLKTIK